jgi:hypothetical protein
MARHRGARLTLSNGGTEMVGGVRCAGWDATLELPGGRTWSGVIHFGYDAATIYVMRVGRVGDLPDGAQADLDRIVAAIKLGYRWKGDGR